MTKKQADALATIRAAGGVGVPLIHNKATGKPTFAGSITTALYRAGLIASREECTNDGLRYFWVATT